MDVAVNDFFDKGNAYIYKQNITDEALIEWRITQSEL
jgi:hypothetical protein